MRSPGCAPVRTRNTPCCPNRQSSHRCPKPFPTKMPQQFRTAAFSHFLRKGNAQSRKRVLVYGASGAIGTSAVQLAKHFAAKVAAVCGPTSLDVVRALGADAVIDYTQEASVDEAARYDLVLDAAGKRKTSPVKEQCRAALAPGGAYVSIDEGMPNGTVGDLEFLTELLATGHLKPVIDRSYPLEQPAAAHEYIELKHKRGNVVLIVSHT